MNSLTIVKARTAISPIPSEDFSVSPTLILSIIAKITLTFIRSDLEKKNGGYSYAGTSSTRGVCTEVPVR